MLSCQVGSRKRASLGSGWIDLGQGHADGAGDELRAGQPEAGAVAQPRRAPSAADGGPARRMAPR